MPVLVPPFLPAGSLSGHVQPSLSVDELTLRPWTVSDLEPLCAAYSDPDIQRWHVRSMTPAEAREWIAGRHDRWLREVGADWAIADSGGIVGRVGLRTLHLNDGHAEVAYWVLPSARRRRIATRALVRLTTWLFDEAGLHRLTLLHSVHNIGSCKVAEGADFDLEGTLKRQLLHADGWHDMHLHARLAPKS
jgi:[ribosomal protein S5]-alanine N-acetyltransferase